MSAVRMVRLAVPSMAARGGGSIVVPTSSSVKEPIANLALSNILRASVAALSKTLANELAGQKIRVNHLIPGRINTDRLRELDEANSKRQGISIEEQQKKMMQTIPMGRYGDPKEFANAAVFLFSDAASYITGATLQADGGQMRGVLWSRNESKNFHGSRGRGSCEIQRSAQEVPDAIKKLRPMLDGVQPITDRRTPRAHRQSAAPDA